jgi:hypothetical protein
MAGKEFHVPAGAYTLSPSRFARALQMGNSLSTLLFSMGSPKALVSGKNLAYICGDLEYSSESIFSRAARLFVHKRPFFVVPGSDPASSIALLTGCDAVPAPQVCLSSQCVVRVTANYKGMPAVFRTGICEEARAELWRRAHGSVIAESDPLLKDLVAETILYSAGSELLVQAWVPGTALDFSWQRVDEVTELWLANSHQSTGIARPNLCEELTLVCDSMPRYRDSLFVLRDSLLHWHALSCLPGEVAHGDLWLGNVLFEKNAITGIIDWEWGHRDGLRLVDVLQVMFMSKAVSQTTSVAHLLREFWADEIQDAGLRDRLKQLCSRLSLNMDDLKFAALLLWFDYLHQRVIRGRMPSVAWTEDMISQTTPVITRWLDRQKTGTRETSELLALAR